VVLIFATVLAACTFFVGDIGVYNDDYFCNQRDPATGEVQDLVMNRPWHLWRPLTRRVLSPLVTLLWPHPWMLHAIDAMIHAAITAMVYALLRRFRVHPGVAGPCALAFMIYPGHFEAVLWIAITCTLLSVLLVLTVWHVYLWWLTRSQAHSIPVRLGALGAMGGLAWCAAAFNEQPPAALVALPFAWLVIGPAAGRSRLHRTVRTALPMVVAGSALLLYVRGFVRNTPGFHGLGVAQQGAVGRLGELVRQLPGESILANFIGGAWRQGLQCVASHPSRAGILLALIGLAALPWCWRGTARRGVPALDRPRAIGLLLLGTVWAAAVWLPVAMAHAHPLPRLFYPSAIGLAIAAAGAVSRVEELGMLRSLSCQRAVRLAFAGASCAGIIVWIGIQDAYQRRFRADVAEVEPLARIFQRSLEPGSIFVPIRILSHATLTGASGFDNYFQQCWQWPLASGWRIRLALHSANVHTVCTGAGAARQGFAVDPRDPGRSVVCAANLAPPKPANAGELLPTSPDAPGRIFPWDRLVLFDVDGAGNTLIYTRVRIHPSTEAAFDLVPRQVERSPLVSELPERILDVYPAPRPPELAPQR
jgi:hypothetical protein